MRWNPATDFCKDCLFWIQHPKDPDGDCRESSPQCCAVPEQVPVVKQGEALIIGKGVEMQVIMGVKAYLPPTGALFGCGKFEPR